MSVNPSPRFGRVVGAIERYGVRRTQLYELAQKNKGLFKKNGTVTIVDFKLLEEILAALPAAEFKANSDNAA
jgi:hypothetical protein